MTTIYKGGRRLLEEKGREEKKIFFWLFVQEMIYNKSTERTMSCHLIVFIDSTCHYNFNLRLELRFDLRSDLTGVILLR